GREVRITPNTIVSIRPEGLSSVESFFDYRMVVLANVADIPENVVAKLEEFVGAGFGLLIFDGPAVGHSIYNSLLYKEGKGLLPVKLGGEGGSNDPAADLFGLVASQPDHPVMRIFSDPPENITIVTDPIAIRNWREVTLPEGPEADP